MFLLLTGPVETAFDFVLQVPTRFGSYCAEATEISPAPKMKRDGISDSMITFVVASKTRD